MAQQSSHKSVFAEYEQSQQIDLLYSQKNPEEKYNFEEEVGRGAFAVIKKCHRKDDKNKTLYAAKMVKYGGKDVEEEEEEETKKLLKREVAMIQKWDHKQYIKLFEVYLVRKYFVLIMEWFDGKNLLPYLIGKQEDAAKIKTKAKLTEKDIATLVSSLCNALKYLHDQNIAYLDIKPDNIMLAKDGTLKLVDYDNCRHIESKQGDVCDCIGTPELTAPEALVFENCSVFTDMWAIGCLMCLMLLAQSPFAAEDEDEVRRKVLKVEVKPKELFKAAMSKEPRQVSPEPVDILEQIFKRIPEKRMSLETLIKHKWLQPEGKPSRFDKSPRKSTTIIAPTAEDYKALKERLDDLESEEPACASCVLRTTEEEEYDTPDEEEDED